MEGKRIIVQLELSLIGKSHPGQRSNILDEERKEDEMRAHGGKSCERWQTFLGDKDLEET